MLQRIYNDSFVQYPGTSFMKFVVSSKKDYLKQAKSKAVDSVVATIQCLMDLQRQVFKQQLREMHRIKDRQHSKPPTSSGSSTASSAKKRKRN